MDPELLKAVADALVQYNFCDGEISTNFEDAMNNMQAQYDRVTGQKDYQETNPTPAP